LERLAQEIRVEITRVVSKTGGHLASNLGTVELTIALHCVFDLRADRLIWDVGHQGYTHKLLTGRVKQFDRLRSGDGVSGFPNPAESDYDVFQTGHAGTAISQALGILTASNLLGSPVRVIAVVGDGAMSTGMSFEALNHAGTAARSPGKNSGLLVILNDNNMSISSSVGAMSEYLSRLRSGHLYHELKREIKQFLDGLPLVGQPMERILEHGKNLLRQNLVPGRLFDDLGFRYYGPVDGHNMGLLLDMLREIDLNGYEYPVLLHVVTEKGKGYPPALEDPAGFHSAKPFHIESGEVVTETEQGETFTEAFSRGLVELAAKDERIVALTAAMPQGAGLALFAREFPSRFFDVGIAEEHAIALAGGLAYKGARPVCAIYSTFLQRAYDQIFHDVALQGLAVVLALDRAGFVTGDGPTHNGLYDIAYLRHLPGIVLMAPSDGEELRAMLAFALQRNCPVAIRYPKDRAISVVARHKALELGLSETLRTGDHVAILAYGVMARVALETADLLETKGVQAEVVNARFCKPLDTVAIASLMERHSLVLTIEDGAVLGGFGSAVLEAANAMMLDTRKLLVLGVADRYFSHDKRSRLMAQAGLDAQSIAAKIMEKLHSEAKGAQSETLLRYHG